MPLTSLISVGIFADGTCGTGFNGVATTVRGAPYGDPGQLVAQLIGVVVFAWAFGVSYVFFKVQDAVQGIRVTEEEEIGRRIWRRWE